MARYPARHGARQGALTWSSEYQLGYSEYPQGYLEYRHGPHLGLHPGYSEYHIEQLWVLLVLTGHYHALQLPGVSTRGNVMGFSE